MTMENRSADDLSGIQIHSNYILKLLPNVQMHSGRACVAPSWRYFRDDVARDQVLDLGHVTYARAERDSNFDNGLGCRFRILDLSDSLVCTHTVRVGFFVYVVGFY